jgi:hypothetical protein
MFELATNFLGTLSSYVMTNFFLLLQRSLLPGGIILQGVLLLQGSMRVFLRATTVRCQLGLLA